LSVTSLYVAPHLDDIALSCAGGVLARARSGRRVVACTVFTKSGDAEIDRTRSDEDARAMAFARAERVDLGFDDAPVRLGVAASFRALALDAPIDRGLVRELTRVLAAEIRRVAATEVWLPLGIGGHIDHRTVFAASAAAGPLARFYEDRPYAFVPAFRDMRRLELVGGKLARPADAAAIAHQLDDGGCAALAVAPADVATLAAKLARRRAPTGTILRTHVTRYDLATLGDAVQMIEAYGSQVSWLFGGTTARELWTRLAARPTGWYEREVRLVTARSSAY
jgi:LmbE family N-acetylglucosaminyl deacetylase